VAEAVSEGPSATVATGDWRAAVARHVGSDVRRSSLQLVITIGLLAATFATMYRLLDWSIFAVLALALPAAGLLVRTFIIMHDCAHGSFFPRRRLNDVVGFITGVITLTPYAQWRRDHALHHASSGDLDRRGRGDIPTLTVREYLARTPWARRVYRTVRHPATLLLIGPLHLLLSQRIPPRGGNTVRGEVTSVWITNLAVALVLALVVFAWGWSAPLLVYLPAWYLAASAGIWLFYVQHQFEDAYWEQHGDWDYATAALKGSSHLRMPALLQWFTGSIGLHHIHHLAPRIPNYRLQECHDSAPSLQVAPVVTLRTGAKALRLALWDETQRRLVRFSAVRHLERTEAPPAIGGSPPPQTSDARIR